MKKRTRDISSIADEDRGKRDGFTKGVRGFGFRPSRLDLHFGDHEQIVEKEDVLSFLFLFLLLA